MNPSDEQVLRAFNQAPNIIQESLSGGSGVDFASTLTNRYNLHIDTAGYVTEFIRNMLLGLLRPEQFIGKLNSVGISDETARRLTADLNKEVFVPLRDKIRQGDSGPKARAIPRVSVPDLQKSSVEAKTPIKTVPEVPPYNLIQPAAGNSVSVPSKAAVSIPPQISSVPVPTMRTMSHDMELIQHGSKPAPYPVAAAQLHPAQATPARSFQTASVPVTLPPAQPAPAPEIVHIVPDASRKAVSSAPQIAQPGEYTSDPYREPI